MLKNFIKKPFKEELFRILNKKPTSQKGEVGTAYFRFLGTPTHTGSIRLLFILY